MRRPPRLPYARANDILLGSGTGPATAAAALALAERSRAQVLSARLRASLAQAPQPDGAGIPPEEEDLLSRIGYLQARLQEPGLGPAERAEILGEISRLEARHAVRRLRASPDTVAVAGPEPSAGLAAGHDTAATGPLDAGAAPSDRALAALRPGERVLSYFLGAERSWLILADGESLQAIGLPARNEIERKAALFLDLIDEARGSDDTPVSLVSRPAPASRASLLSPASPAGLPGEILDRARREMHALLLGGASAALRPGESLIIVPDGILHRLPFAQLRGPDGFLIERHAITLAPSLGSLAAIRRRAADRGAERAPTLDLIAVGYGGERASAPGSPGRVLPFSEEPVAHLPHTDGEARRVSSLFERALVLTGRAANERAVREAPLDACEVLHVAAHGWADASEVRRSFILLAPPASPARSLEGTSGDGLLQWDEVAALRLRASLVTLSACHSAGGVLDVGEGVTGLTQAFLHAGATCVLAAQAEVSDRSSERLMRSFYRSLLSGETAAGALRAAQRDAIRSGPEGSGAGWSRFVLVGDGGVRIAGAAGRRPASPPEHSVLPAFLALGLALFCVIALRSGSNRWRRS
jgi:hypothetical protein